MTGHDVQFYNSNTVKEEYLHNTIKLFLTEVYDVMKECYGPYGSHVLIPTQIRVEATKDGKTILSKIQTNSSISSSIHNTIMDVANKQVEEVGDGSTTTILLLCKLYTAFREIIKTTNVSSTAFNETLRTVVNLLRVRLSESAQDIVTYIGEEDDIAFDVAIDFDMLYNAIYTSVDGDKELATQILEMFKELNSVEPLVLIETSNTNQHRYELVKGVELDGTVIRPDIFFSGYSRMSYTNPLVMMINGRLDLKLEFFTNLAQALIKEDQDIIFVCCGINENTLEGITQMHSSGAGMFNRIAVLQTMVSATTDEFLDACAALGAKPVDSDTLLKVSNMATLNKIITTNAGTCTKATLTEFSARFNEPKSDDSQIRERLDSIAGKIKDLEDDSTSHNDKISDLENRKAFLSKNYAKFYVGGYSPQRKTINYELASDAIPQAISCMKHGIVAGCNTIVPKLCKAVFSESNDSHIPELEILIYYAIQEAYEDLHIQLIANKVGNKADAVKLFDKFNGDAINLRQTADWTSIPVINSADTDRAILENAIDMAALLATTKAYISNRPEFDVVNKGYMI